MFPTAYCLKSLGGVRGRDGLSREIQHSNKAQRYHNDNFFISKHKDFSQNTLLFPKLFVILKRIWRMPSPRYIRI